MASWYGYSIAALLLLGSQRFLYKVAAERRCNSGFTTAIFMGTVTVLSGAVFLTSGASATNFSALIILSLVNSVSFAGATIAHMEALKHLPAGITFPLTRLSLVMVVLVSVVAFDERLTPWQWFGVLLGLAVVAILARDAGQDGRPEGNRRCGFLLVGGCVLCGTVAAVSSKLAAVSTSLAGFMGMSYLLGTFFALAIERKWGGGTTARQSGEAIGIGIMMGILNFFGFYAFLEALTRGPLSVITMITGMHFVIAILLSAWLFHEKLTLRRGVGLGLTLLAVVVLKQ